MGEGNKRRGAGGGGGGKKAKHYAPRPAGSGQALPHGSTGIIITCAAGREDKTVDSMRAVIEEHYEALLKKAGTDENGSAAASGGGQDVAAALAAEVEALKDKTTRKFPWVQTGIRGVVFIKFPEEAGGPSPLAVVQSICDEAVAKETLRSRFVNRILPITNIGYASVEEMKGLAPKVLAAEFPADADSNLNFSVDFEHRSSDKFDRMEVINAFVDSVPTPPYKVNLNNPDKSILVQVIRNACAVGVATRYRELHRFNLRRCAGLMEDEPGTGKPTPKKEEAKAAEAAPASADKEQTPAPNEEKPAAKEDDGVAAS